MNPQLDSPAGESNSSTGLCYVFHVLPGLGKVPHSRIYLGILLHVDQSGGR